MLPDEDFLFVNLSAFVFYREDINAGREVRELQRSAGKTFLAIYFEAVQGDDLQVGTAKVSGEFQSDFGFFVCRVRINT